MAACARPGYHEPTSEQQTAGSMWALARDHSVTPGVTSLTAPAPTSGNRWFARPWFPIGVPHCAEHRQAGFCPCTLRRSSDPPEPTFGHPRYLFGGVPPQPNSPPDVVPGSPRLAVEASRGGVSLAPPRPPQGPLRRLPPTLRKDASTAAPGCCKAPRGLHLPSGVGRMFTAKSVRRVPGRDSGGLVTPFMQAAN
ncbi:MAG: hypothetical protein PWQ11_556 [Candidatus Diapherotrites archaeon]|nr:hypothetical protein [Candidatus Diapherotrites archaeon]